MAEEDTVGDQTGDDAKRRSTFTPPPADATFPERLGELDDSDIQAAKRASEAAAAQPTPAVSETPENQGTYRTAPAHPEPEPTLAAPAAPTIPPAPTRSSLGDEEIMEQFRDGTIPSTEGMMSALEAQLSLRTDEEERFAAWEETVRELLPEEEAYQVIAPARLEFGGLAPLEEPQSLVSPEPVVEPDPAAEPEHNPLLAAMAADTGDIDQPEHASSDAPESPLGEFDSVVSDQDAVSPPTSQWPLVIEQDSDGSAEQHETADEVEAPADSDTDQVVEVESEDERRPEEPSLVSAGVAVGTDTVTISDVVATKDIPVDSFPVAVSEKERWFAFDRVGIEPAPEVNRTSGALQLFWTWWAASIPLAGIIVGAWLMAIGNGLLQALVATVAGVLIGSLPLIVGTVSGIRLGLPALIVSRQAFGLVGNLVPAVLMLVVRLAVSALFIWAAVWIASGIYVQANLWRLDRVALEVILATVAVVVVGTFVMAGRRIVSVLLWVSAGLSLVAAAVLVVLTWDIPTRASIVAGDWNLPLLVSSASIVAAILMILWAQSGADVARFSPSGAAAGRTTMVSIAAVIPPILFIGWGTILGASGRSWRSGVLADPFNAVLSLAPAWYPIPALVLLAIPLLGLAALALHSSSYAVMSLGVSITRYVAAAAVTVAAAAAVFAVLLILGDPTIYLVDVVRVVGVVVAAWTGVFVADALTRRTPLRPEVLLGASGTYPAVRIAPLAGFLVAIAAGWGFTVSAMPILSWLGYLVGPLADTGLINLAPYQLGVVVSLVLSFIVAAFAGIRGGQLTGAKKVEA